MVAYAASQELTRGQRRREKRPAIEHIGIDLHKKKSQICVLAEEGELAGALRITPEDERR